MMDYSNYMDEDAFTKNGEVKEKIEREISEVHSSINYIIEDFLRRVDKAYGTDYCPTGSLRI